MSGLRILDAILAGDRDPVNLARLCHSGVKSSQDTIAKSLEGDYRPEHLFALRQSLAAFHYYQQLVVEVDQEIQGQLGSLGTATTAEPTVPTQVASPDDWEAMLNLLEHRQTKKRKSKEKETKKER